MKFKSTGHALSYGQTIKGNKVLIQRLEKELETKRKETDIFLKIENPTDEQIQQGYDLAVESQLLNEALHEAKGE